MRRRPALYGAPSPPHLLTAAVEEALIDFALDARYAVKISDMARTILAARARGATRSS